MSKSLKGMLSILLAAAIPACAAGDESGYEQVGGDGGSGAGGEQACVPNHQTQCACPGGGQGIQICNLDGSGFGACDCSGVGAGGSTSSGTGGGGSDPCGDGLCAPGEDCHSCTQDCGVCEPCDIAPSCDNSMIPPADVPHLTDFDVPAMVQLSTAQIEQRLIDAISQGGSAMRVLAASLSDPTPGEHRLVTKLREIFAAHPEAAAAVRRQLDRKVDVAGAVDLSHYGNMFPVLEQDVPMTPMDVEYPGGTMECGAPMLRMTIASITVHEEDDDFANDIVYCIAQSETANGGEIRVTPQTSNLDQGESYQFAIESGVFWGQLGPATPGGNIQITYDCIEADTNDGYQNLIDAIGGAADGIGDVIPGDSGWIFETVADIAPIVSGGLALDGDDHLFNAQQIIPLDRQLELTNGAYWTVRRNGTHILSDWDWEIFIKAWGCAEYGTL